jgi:hypothetical protein
MQDTAESPAPRADARPAKPGARAVSTSHTGPKPLNSLASLPIGAAHGVSGISAPPETDPAVPFDSPAPRQQSVAAESKPPVTPPRPSERKPPFYATGKPVPVPTNAFVVSLAQDKAGNVWVGTEDLGVFRYDPCAAGSAQWTEFTTRDGLGDDNAYALCVDQLNRVWVGHLNHGVSVFNGESWVNYDILDGPIGERIFSIAADPKSGDVWIATSAGLTRYSLEADTCSHYTRDDGLPSDQIQSLAFDANGNLYAGTQCDGLAIADAAHGYRRWRQVVGSDAVPLVPSGPGLPSNLINDVLVSRRGVVFVATTCGLAASKDHGKSWAFVRGADWGAKVKGLYGGPPRGWREGPAAFLLSEDYCTRLAEDDSGLLWIGHRQTGYEAIDPATLQRRFDSRAAKKGNGGDKSMPDYVAALLGLSRRDPLVGWYGNGLTPDTDAGHHGVAALAAAAPIHPAHHPTPAGPPTLDELNSLLAKLGSVPTLRQFKPTVVQIPDDWRTEGDWLGRYGRYWACLCAIDSPHDYIWGAGPELVRYEARIGPHSTADDSLRYWVHWLATDNRRSLEMPPAYLDSRIRRGETTHDTNRRQAEWDDHGEAYPQAHQGPDVYCTLEIPAGQFYLSLYDFNKDGHEGDNCLRDYQVSVRPRGSVPVRQAAADFERHEEVARGRICGFWGGVWLRYYVQGAFSLTIQLNKGSSKNTILAGMMLDYVDERPVPYFCTLHEWQDETERRGGARAALLAESTAQRSGRFLRRSDPNGAATSLCDELESARLRNAPWWAAASGPYYAALLRWCRRAGTPPGANRAAPPLVAGYQEAATPAAPPDARLATCCYQLRLFTQWEELQHAGGLLPARDIEHAIRWDGFSASNSGYGFRNVVYYMRRAGDR